MKYKCLILDHDDTALDSTRQLHHPAYCEMLKVMRPDAPLPDLKEFIMLNFDPGFVPHLKENLDFTDEEIDIEYDMWLKYVDGKCADFFPGWLDLIRDFQAEGGIVTVASHSAEEVIRENYRKYGIELGLVFGYSKNPEENKPNPYPVQQILKEYNLDPSECLVVDDLQFGGEMGHKCGVKFACAGWSHNGLMPVINYMKENSDWYFDTIQELRDFIFED